MRTELGTDNKNIELDTIQRYITSFPKDDGCNMDIEKFDIVQEYANNPYPDTTFEKFYDDLNDDLNDEVSETFFSQNINRIFNEIKKILVIKNTNYDSSFDKLRKEYGPTSFLIRLKDKLFRYESLALSDDKNCDDERIEDTLKDIIGYTMLELLFRDKFSKEEALKNE